MKKFLIILLLIVSLSGCNPYIALREKESVLIDYPEINLVLTFSNDFKLEEMPHELDSLGYKMDDVIQLHVGDSVPVLDEMFIAPEILEKEDNGQVYKVYRYYRSNNSFYASRLDFYWPVLYVDLYIKDSKIEIIKVAQVIM